MFLAKVRVFDAPDLKLVTLSRVRTPLEMFELSVLAPCARPRPAVRPRVPVGLLRAAPTARRAADGNTAERLAAEAFTPLVKPKLCEVTPMLP